MHQPSSLASRKLKLWTFGHSSQNTTQQSLSQCQHNQSYSQESTGKSHCIENPNSLKHSAPISLKNHKTIWDDGHKRNRVIFSSNKQNPATKSRTLRSPMSQVVNLNRNISRGRELPAQSSPQITYIQLKDCKMKETNFNSFNCNVKEKSQVIPKQVPQPAAGIMNFSYFTHHRNKKNHNDFNKTECDKNLNQYGFFQALGSYQQNHQQVTKTQPNLRINLTNSTTQYPQTPQNSYEIQSNQLSPLHRSFPPPQKVASSIPNTQPSFEDSSFAQSYRSITKNNISGRPPLAPNIQDPSQAIPSNLFSDKPIRSCTEQEQTNININPTSVDTFRNQHTQQQQEPESLVGSQQCWEQPFKSSFSSCNSSSARICIPRTFSNNQIYNQKQGNNHLNSSTIQYRIKRNTINLPFNNNNNDLYKNHDQRQNIQRTSLRATLNNKCISKNTVNFEQPQTQRLKKAFQADFAQFPKPYQELYQPKVDYPCSYNTTRTTAATTASNSTRQSFYSPFQEALRHHRQVKLQTFRNSNVDIITEHDLKQRNIERLFDKQPLDYLKEFLHALVFTQRDLERHRVKAALEEEYSLQLFYELFDKKDEGKITMKLFKTGLNKLGVNPDQEDLQLLISSYAKSKEASFLTEEDFHEMVIPKSIVANERLFVRKPMISDKNLSDKMRQSFSQLMKNALNGEIILEKLRDQMSKEEIDLEKLFDEWMHQIKSLSSQLSTNNSNQSIDTTTMRQLFLECGVFIHKEEIPPLMRKFTQNDGSQSLNRSKFVVQLTPRLS